MIVHRAFPSGAWVISNLSGSHLTTKTYYGYTRKEAIKMFLVDEQKGRDTMSRNACAWCGTEVEDERQYELAICEPCYRDSQYSLREDIAVEEARDNGLI